MTITTPTLPTTPVRARFRGSKPGFVLGLVLIGGIGVLSLGRVSQ